MKEFLRVLRPAGRSLLVPVLLFFAISPAQAQTAALPGGTLGEMVNGLAGNAAGGNATGMLANAVSEAVTEDVLNSVQDVLDNVSGAAEIEAAAEQISSLLDITAGDAAGLVQDALNGELIGGSLESALNDMLTETVAQGIDELLGGQSSAELMNIISGLLGGLSGAATSPAALLAALNSLGIPLSSLGLTEEHLNALLGLSVPLCPVAGGAPLVCSATTWDPATATTVSSAAALQSAINGIAQSGGTILLAPGNYGSLSGILSGLNPGQNITIASADPNNPAIIESTQISNSSNLTFANLNFFAEGTPETPKWPPGVTPPIVQNGPFMLPQQPGKTGLGITGSNNITVTGSVFSGHTRGTMTSESSNISITGNSFANSSMDHMAFTEVTGVLIEGNYTKNIDPLWGSHNDAIQFWHTVHNDIPSSNITIRNNVLTSDAPSNKGVQSIFLLNETVVRENGTAEDYFKNILIEGNTIVATHPNAITVAGANGVTIQNNSVKPACGLTQPGWNPIISLNAVDQNVNITGNTASRIIASSGQTVTAVTTPGAWNVSGNTLDTSCVPIPELSQAPGCANTGQAAADSSADGIVPAALAAAPAGG